jgi:hypothetical protein
VLGNYLAFLKRHFGDFLKEKLFYKKKSALF